MSAFATQLSQLEERLRKAKWRLQNNEVKTIEFIADVDRLSKAVKECQERQRAFNVAQKQRGK